VSGVDTQRAASTAPSSLDRTDGASGPAGHLSALRSALDVLADRVDDIERWADDLADRFARGATLLVAGNGGSAALAAHLTGELVGRYRRERDPLPAIWLGADQSALSAIVNDYASDEMFARQVDAFTRPDDVVLLLSTSGRSPNLLTAARRAGERGAEVWAMTGPRPNPLAGLASRVLDLPGVTATVQEAQQVAVHLLCEALDDALERRPAHRHRERSRHAREHGHPARTQEQV
jgi:D-sedoheptulose 7-phosphate isomerase